MPIRMSPNRGSSCWLPLQRFRAAVVGDLAEVDVGDGLPDRRGLLELELPGRRGELGVEGLEQGTRGAADARAVGHEAVSDPAAVDQVAAEGGVEQEAVFQTLQAEANRSLSRAAGRLEVELRKNEVIIILRDLLPCICLHVFVARDSTTDEIGLTMRGSRSRVRSERLRSHRSPKRTLGLRVGSRSDA